MARHLMNKPPGRLSLLWARFRMNLAWAVAAAALVFAVVTGFMGMGLLSFLQDFSPGPAHSDQEAAATASPSPTWEWPVQTREPDPGLVPGEGTFLDPATVDRADRDAVAEATATLLASHDAETDATQAAADDRARAFYAPEVPEYEDTQGNGVGELWLQAQVYDGYSVPAVTPLDPAVHAHEGEDVLSADGEVVTPYEFRVLYHWQGRKKDEATGVPWTSDTDAPEVRTVRLSLAERDGRWVVVERFYGTAEATGYAG